MVDHICEPICARRIACCRSAGRPQRGVKRPLTPYGRLFTLQGYTASGDRYCAVLDDKGEWQRFRMDLGDHFQRMAFRAGEVPQMAVRLQFHP